jgi:hypothetical protein
MKMPRKYRILEDPYFPADKVLTGLKGSTFLDHGVVYAPYMPELNNPQDDFSPVKGNENEQTNKNRNI